LALKASPGFSGGHTGLVEKKLEGKPAAQKRGQKPLSFFHIGLAMDGGWPKERFFPKSNPTVD